MSKVTIADICDHVSHGQVFCDAVRVVSDHIRLSASGMWSFREGP